MTHVTAVSITQPGPWAGGTGLALVCWLRTSSREAAASPVGSESWVDAATHLAPEPPAGALSCGALVLLWPPASLSWVQDGPHHQPSPPCSGAPAGVGLGSARVWGAASAPAPAAGEAQACGLLTLPDRSEDQGPSRPGRGVVFRQVLVGSCLPDPVLPTSSCPVRPLRCWRPWLPRLYPTLEQSDCGCRDPGQPRGPDQVSM